MFREINSLFDDIIYEIRYRECDPIDALIEIDDLIRKFRIKQLKEMIK